MEGRANGPSLVHLKQKGPASRATSPKAGPCSGRNERQLHPLPRVTATKAIPIPPAWPAPVRSDQGPQSGTPVLPSAGRHLPQKGQLTLARAVERFEPFRRLVRRPCAWLLSCDYFREQARADRRLTFYETFTACRSLSSNSINRIANSDNRPSVPVV